MPGSLQLCAARRSCGSASWSSGKVTISAHGILLVQAQPISLAQPTMKMPKKPRNICLEIRRRNKSFSPECLEYEIRHTRAERSVASFPWDDSRIRKAYDEFHSGQPSSEALELLGEQ